MATGPTGNGWGTGPGAGAETETAAGAGEAEAGTGAARGTDAGRDVGRRRTEAGTSGRGESVATISSISGFLSPRAESSTSR